MGDDWTSLEETRDQEPSAMTGFPAAASGNGMQNARGVGGRHRWRVSEEEDAGEAAVSMEQGTSVVRAKGA